MIRTLITLLVQEFYRPRRPDPLDFVTPTAPVLTPKQTYELLDQMDGDLWRAVVANKGAEKRTTAEVLDFLAPRRRQARRWLR